MTPVVLLAALSLLLLLFVRRRPRRIAPDPQRQIAERAHLDTYRPHDTDRFWDDWASHHGGGL